MPSLRHSTRRMISIMFLVGALSFVSGCSNSHEPDTQTNAASQQDNTRNNSSKFTFTNLQNNLRLELVQRYDITGVRTPFDKESTRPLHFRQRDAWTASLRGKNATPAAIQIQLDFDLWYDYTVQFVDGRATLFPSPESIIPSTPYPDDLLRSEESTPGQQNTSTEDSPDSTS